MGSLDNPVWRFFTFADVTLYESSDAARVRASWPTWRRAVRPIGAAAWWAGIVAGWFIPGVDESHNPLSYDGVFLIGLIIIACCVGYGTIDGYRTRARLRALAATPAAEHGVDS